MKFHRQPDRNTKVVVAALREVGASVEYVENTRKAGVFDLLVGYAGTTYVMEVKAPDAKLRNRERGGRILLSEAQEAWAETWKGGPLCIVQTVAEALVAIGHHTPHLDV